MKLAYQTLLAGVALTASSLALAAGELNLYNWGNYTSPKLIEKFEAETGIKVTITDYDSNETALAKVRAGGHGLILLCHHIVIYPSGYPKV